ncbi:MAG: hypothetical protein ACR2OD_10075, partial [Gaiellaceae bacterium]
LSVGDLRRESFVRGDLPVVEFAASTPGANLLAGVMGGAVLVALVAAYVPNWGPLVRGVVIAEATLFGAAGAFMLATGRPPFAAGEFAALYTETAALTWLILPLLLGVVSLSVPFRVWERALLMMLVLAYGGLLSVARLGFFAEALGAGSSVLMAPLFLNFGPLLDFIGAVAIFSVMLVRVSARLERGEPRRVWSWS